MSRIPPMPFQQQHIDALLARFTALKSEYDKLGKNPTPSDLKQVREQSACVMLQAPTGIGKTLMACELLARFTPEEQILWFWFAPFAGIIGQAERALMQQAPSLPRLDIEADRRPDALTQGGIFVLTWQTVAARSKESRLARTSGDAGMAIDDVILVARDQGFRIGVVVDEAHHGFVRAPESCRFFKDVLAPEYVLLMTATPRDQDAGKFSAATGYRLGGPSEWASVTRAEGVAAQLLKKSVKAARFIAKNQDDAQLIAYEEVAMMECAAMHRHIKKTLAQAGVGLTPLMLVQVPNGGAAMKSAREFLVEKLKFPADSVKAHTADEPDPNLAALADDPAVEVILFKMAIATGFDAPRAFTLAALRGARDIGFGIQVVGRIMRVHRLLQGRLQQVPPELSFGYVFLANDEAQEGLVGAANAINDMPEHLASAGTSIVVTVVADSPMVQVVRPGQSLSLLPAAPDGANPPAGKKPELPAMTPPAESTPSQTTLFADVVGSGKGLSQALFATAKGEPTPLTKAFELDAKQAPKRYPRRNDVPAELVTEALPELPDDFEERLVSHIDFAKVLGDRLKVRSRVTERVTDVFEGSLADRDIWATVSPVAIAEKARQLAFEFDDVDRRELLTALKDRFQEALVSQGHEPPKDDEELTRQLELVLVRNPRLIRDAYKRVRAEQVQSRKVHIRDAVESELPLEPSARNIYGVFPPDLNHSEREFASMLDTADEVLWWHRNPVRKPDSVALYGWSDGIGFFPDFVVGVAGRKEGEGAALTELKGPHLLEVERKKAGAVHPVYGRVFMVGREEMDGPFRLWKLASGDLVDDGPFEPRRLRYS